MILDREAARGRDLLELAEAAVRGGADVLQLRDKRSSPEDLIPAAARLAAFARERGIPLIINDYPDVARAAGAAGVHVGQDDMPVAQARAAGPEGGLVGKSTHSILQARSAAAEGADYIGVGPIFATPTKPDYGEVGLRLISAVAREISIPFVCIGGIDASTIQDVCAAGASCVAVVRAVCGEADPESAARGLKALLENAPGKNTLA